MAAVLKLLERQLGLWELKRRVAELGERPGRCLEGHVAYGPCLLVSREVGSSGSEVGRLVGERLGWQVFDRQVVEEIGRLAHVRQQLIESVDPATRSKWNNSWEPELQPEDIGWEQYLRFLREVILTLGHHGDVVILGRGAQYLLPSQCALRVRIVAPLGLRAERLAKEHSVSELEARAHAEEIDAAQAEFIRKCFRQDTEAALNYDLVINGGELKVEAAVEMVLLGLRRKLGVGPHRA